VRGCFKTFQSGRISDKSEKRCGGDHDRKRYPEEADGNEGERGNHQHRSASKCAAAHPHDRLEHHRQDGRL
jgi:hypothetical protein